MTSYQDDTFKCLCEIGFLGEYCEKGRYHSSRLFYKIYRLLTYTTVHDIRLKFAIYTDDFFACGHHTNRVVKINLPPSHVTS